MSLLARYLADRDSKTTIPFTNFEKSWEINYKPTDNRQKFVCANIFMNLPVPKDSVNLEQILEFKRNHNPDFVKLHEDIATLEQKVKKMDIESDIEEECKTYIRHISIDVEQIKQKFQDEQIKTFSASIRSCLSKDALYSGAASGILINQLFSMSTGLSITPASLAISESAAILGQSFLRIFDGWVHNKAKENAELREFPFSYFYKAESSGIIDLTSKVSIR